jgi:hypothetical protein
MIVRMRQIEVSVDVFAAIWAQRLPSEGSEEAILARILKVRPKGSVPVNDLGRGDAVAPTTSSRPKSKKWTDVLEWTLNELGGGGPLSAIYKKSREGRVALGIPITAEHDASARECLESHCIDSQKFRGKANLFYMPEGKGAGVWALRRS